MQRIFHSGCGCFFCIPLFSTVPWALGLSGVVGAVIFGEHRAMSPVGSSVSLIFGRPFQLI
jgi:hypothetical protein